MAELNFVKRGQELNFSKSNPGLKKVRVSLLWKEHGGYDADLSAFILGDKNGDMKIMYLSDPSYTNEHGVPIEMPALIGYPAVDREITDASGNEITVKATPNLSVIHFGDNRDGGTVNGIDGEQIDFDFSKMPSEYIQIPLIATIYNGNQRNQNWNTLEASLTITNLENNEVIAEYKLENDFPQDTAVHVGTFTKDRNGEIVFRAVGAGSKDELEHFYQNWS